MTDLEADFYMKVEQEYYIKKELKALDFVIEINMRRMVSNERY